MLLRSWESQFCMSVRPSVTCCLVTNERTFCRYFDTIWKSNHSSLLTPTRVGSDFPFHLKFAAKVAHPLWKRRLRPISAYNVSTVKFSKKVQLLQIGSQSRAFQQTVDDVRTLPLTPRAQRVAQKANLSFLWIKINLNRINSATKFPCVKTFSGKVVVNPFHYLM